MAWSNEEYKTKLARIRGLMSKEELDYIIISSQINFFWLTGGRPYVNMLGDKACASIVVTGDKEYLIANNIEVNRLMSEELRGLPIEPVSYEWWRDEGAKDILAQLTDRLTGRLDTDMGVRFSSLRYVLLPEEVERFKDTGKSVSKVLDEIGLAVKPGESENDVLEKLKTAAAKWSVNPWVALVAADDRAYKYRHPLPTDKKIDKYVLIAISGQKYGLFASATRLVHFGTIPNDLKKRHEAVSHVDAAFISNTLAGKQVKDVFSVGCQEYAAMGYPDEWHYHHQGGLAGYNSREFRASSECERLIHINEVFAWNPTIAGAKSEDTILVTDDGPEVLTKSDIYPEIQVERNGRILSRPDILVR